MFHPARILAALILVTIVGGAQAGPPFRTDDPEPVPYRHWEFYLASTGGTDAGGSAFTAPHFEANYGPVPGVQIHMIAPLMSVRPDGAPSHFGFGDMELGAKLRFLQETDGRPQVGVFPLVLVPTGSTGKGLGSGETEVYVPVWIQKDIGAWTTYGGGGVWFNGGEGNQDSYFVGWEAQRAVSSTITLGGEVFHETAAEKDGRASTGFTLGTVIDFSELHHLLLSAGRAISGPNEFSFFVGYQITVGPGSG